MGLLNVIAPKNVKYRLTGRNQMISDDPPKAAPPHSLSAHNCTLLGMPQFAQPSQTRLEHLGHCVVCVIVKALILPIPIYIRRYVPTPSAPAPERRNMFVVNLKLRQCSGKYV
jgi:hypothetical protein